MCKWKKPYIYIYISDVIAKKEKNNEANKKSGNQRQPKIFYYDKEPPYNHPIIEI